MIIYNPLPESFRCIGVPAPASCVDKEKIGDGCRMAERLGVKISVGDFFSAPRGEKYFSSDVPYRMEEMNNFLHNGKIDMILCARGGYGSAYLLPSLDYEALKNRKFPLAIGGFSDITALHLALLSKNIAGGIACPMFGHFADICRSEKMASSMRETLSAFLKMGDLLMSSPPEKILEKRKTLRWKKICSCRHSFGENEQILPVTAPVIPANLTLLTRLCGTPYLPDFTGKLLLLEEVGELPRKVDFSFLQLLYAGVFQKCAGILLGQYTNCGKRSELYSIFRRFARMSQKPFYGFIPFGHGKETLSLICNEPCRIEKNGSLYLLRER